MWYTGNRIKGSNPFISASNIEHPVVIPWDVLFRPVPCGFCGRHFQCISPVANNPPKFTAIIYLAQKCNATLFTLPLENCQKNPTYKATKKGNNMAVKNILKMSTKTRKSTKQNASVCEMPLKEKMVDYCKQTDTDMLLFNGSIGDSVGITNGFVDFILSRPHKKNCMLFLTTYGGDANWAFKIYKALKTTYDEYDVVVCGFCKSAGTLITLGARQLFFQMLEKLGHWMYRCLKKMISLKTNPLWTCFVHKN